MLSDSIRYSTLVLAEQGTLIPPEINYSCFLGFYVFPTRLGEDIIIYILQIGNSLRTRRCGLANFS